MYKTNINPALAQMDLAQDEIATYSMLLKRAQSVLTASSQAFERANETSITGNCRVRQELTKNLRQQYAALTNLTSAIVETLAAPVFSRIIATAPNESPKLVALLKCLPEEESKLINLALTSLLKGESEKVSLSEEQVELAARILAAGR